MIIFKRVSYKNFLSSGNSPIEVDLRTHPRVLIAGTNGMGKSTILSAITFALFGKPLNKNVNKPNLINSINGKQLLVEIEFSIGVNEYSIRRGIKPNIFEVTENGKLLDQTLVRDYQEYLEKNILKTNFRAFTQTTIISVDNYVPFMELRSYDRRLFIEELLDISVFSTMNLILKNQMTEIKDQLSSLETKIKSTKEKVVLQKSHLMYIESEKKKGIQSLEDKISECKSDIEKSNIELDFLEDRKKTVQAEIQKAKDEVEKVNRLNSMRSQLLASLTKLDEKITFYHDIDNCPTCKQGIEHNHKTVIISESEKKKNEVKDAIEKLDSKLADIIHNIEVLGELQNQYSTINDSMTSILSSIRQSNRTIDSLLSDIKSQKDDSSKIDEEKAKLRQMAEEALQLSKEKAELSELRQYQEVAYNLLKDTGIKAKIIKQYIPIINALVNKYLGQLDFFVSFELDENFNETVKSRHRDTFTYHNFSAGERSRIDLALMMTFRQISKYRNSFNSNLLILDEVLDSSLDSAGIDSLTSIFSADEFAQTNIFVISHRNKDSLMDKFDHLIEIEKVGNFSEIVNR